MSLTLPNEGCVFVVVRGEPGDLEYHVGSQGWKDARGIWSRDPSRALRYLSKEAAAIHQAWYDDSRIEEHMWVERDDKGTTPAHHVPGLEEK